MNRNVAEDTKYSTSFASNPNPRFCYCTEAHRCFNSSLWGFQNNLHQSHVSFWFISWFMKQRKSQTGSVCVLQTSWFISLRRPRSTSLFPESCWWGCWRCSSFLSSRPGRRTRLCQSLVLILWKRHRNVFNFLQNHLWWSSLWFIQTSVGKFQRNEDGMKLK